ncbi:MAG TPA: Gfo/Idh/MocA family oxidoreductase [Verrucomicrobiae bacterium]|jgi:predicted dehydrogenase
MKKLRVGFISTAGIGKKNWKAIFHSGNCLVTAVASRSHEKSQQFIDECQQKWAFAEQPAAFGSYEELLASEMVDAVYIPLPTALRKEFVLRAAAHRKHVVCEKPCAINATELAEMIAACEKHGVQFMDGVMFMHGPRLAKVREVLADNVSVGAIRRISSAFSFYPDKPDFFKNNIRANGALEPTGCLGDLGWYSIRFALWTLNWQLPHTVTAKILAQSEALPGRPSAPTDVSVELFFADDVSVSFYSSFLNGHQQWAHVSGPKGWLLLPDFVHPFNSYEPAFEVNRKIVVTESNVKCPPGVDATVQGHATAHDAWMWRHFADQIASGKLNAEWPMWSTKTQRVLDACFEAARKNCAVKLA